MRKPTKFETGAVISENSARPIKMGCCWWKPKLANMAELCRPCESVSE
jgi:hypothetical protein